MGPLRTGLRTAARRLVRDVYRTFDATVAASASVARELQEFGVPRVVHIPLGVDTARFRPRGPGERATRAELGIPEGPALGVYVGRFAPEKRLDVALDGHARIPADRRPHLLLVGDGPDRPALERRSRSQEGLFVAPYQASREAVARIYGAADFYLATGPGETFGLSIAEALASGLPVVTVRRGAGPDRVAGADVAEGYRHDDDADAARAILTLVDRLGSEIATRARQHAEASYDWASTFESLLRVYHRVASRGG
jgi:alpha-1,6-mannosyltransferase